MHNAAIVSVGNSLADGDKCREQTTKFKARLGGRVGCRANLMTALDGFIHRFAVDVTHVVKELTVFGTPHAVQRHNSRMFQATGDFSFKQKAITARAIFDQILVDEFNRHLAIEFSLGCTVDGSEATFRVKDEGSDFADGF